MVYDILQAEVFCDASKAPNPFFAGATPRTLLGSSRRSFKSTSRLGKGIPLFLTSSTPTAPRFWCLRRLTLS